MAIVEITWALPSKRQWRRCPLRKAKKYRTECKICDLCINAGDEYYDRGFNRLAHKDCVDTLEI